MIRITKLNKYFNKNSKNEIHVINDSTIEFPNCGLVTLLGESGSGKTTLLNVIGGLDNFNSGEIEIDGVKITKYSSKKIDKIRNEKIGYIFQNYLLLYQKTVYENLKLVLNMYELTENEKNERIDYVLNAVGILKFKNKKASELSGGQQQRVAIARALIKSPTLILADEPTGNLDEKNTIEIMNILKKISENTLVILVSHERKIANTYSDLIIEVKDGKIDSKKINEKKDYYYEDNQNIYLKELEYLQMNSNRLSVDYYSDSKVINNIRVIYYNGKLYIDGAGKIEILSENTQIDVINDYKKALVVEEEVTNNYYDLKKIKFIKTPSLSIKEQIFLAINNISKAKKKLYFINITLFIMIILILLSIQSIVNASYIDKRVLTNTDSRVYNVYLEKVDATIDNRAGKFGLELFYYDFIKENPDIEPIINFSTDLYYTMDTFNQFKSNDYMMSNFSVLPLSALDETKIKYGRIPENEYEIVVDKWVLQNFIEDSILSNFMNVTSFLNQKVRFKGMNYESTIVGIAESEENSIYVDKWDMINYYMATVKRIEVLLCPLSKIEKYLGKKLNISLEKNEAIWNEARSKTNNLGYFDYNDDENIRLNIIDEMDFEGLGYYAVVSDELYNDVLLSVLKREYNTLNLICENADERNCVIEFVEKNAEKFSSGEIKATGEYGYDGPEPENIDVKLVLSSKSEYDLNLQPHIKEANKIVLSRMLITITIIIIAIMIIYFTMKSFVINNIYDIGVYRAIGINKRSVELIYLFEILFISLKTILLGGGLCFLITNFIASIPIIETNFAVSFLLFISVSICLIIINILVGVFPVIRCLKKTPSQILSKTDY